MADLDDDLLFALYIQEEFDKNNSTDFRNDDKTSSDIIGSSSKPTSIVDPSWELIDPIPDVRQLFLQFNDAYFDGLLAGVEVRWSPRMTLCAGLCCYEGQGGLCSIRLSEPLLKLRPRKDLVETLLHEMIHALLFVTDNNKDHDGHGPEFLKHMHRINKETGTNITVFHNFHDEVDSYRQHWWKCDGPCQKRPPYFGVVRRAMNRAPSPRDPWWVDHQRICGGAYHKIKEPENYGKKGSKSKSVDSKSKTRKKQKEKNLFTLDNFFEKRKRESGGPSDDSSTSGNENKRFKLTDENRCIDNVEAFSGSGYALGSSAESQSVNIKGNDSQNTRQPLIQKAFSKKAEQDNCGINDIFKSDDSCLKTVREKWLAKWKKKERLKLGTTNYEEDKNDCKRSSIRTTTSESSSSKNELNQREGRKNKNDSCRKNDRCHNKIESPNNSHKTNLQCLTTEEAFKTGINERVNLKTEIAAQTTTMLGSSEKPIEILGDTQFSMNRWGVRSTYIDLSEESPLDFSIVDQYGESLSPLANANKSVACPACRSLILERHINNHLDQCLQ